MGRNHYAASYHVEIVAAAPDATWQGLMTPAPLTYDGAAETARMAIVSAPSGTTSRMVAYHDGVGTSHRYYAVVNGAVMRV